MRKCDSNGKCSTNITVQVGISAEAAAGPVGAKPAGEGAPPYDETSGKGGADGVFISVKITSDGIEVKVGGYHTSSDVQGARVDSGYGATVTGGDEKDISGESVSATGDLGPVAVTGGVSADGKTQSIGVSASAPLPGASVSKNTTVTETWYDSGPGDGTVEKWVNDKWRAVQNIWY